MTGSTWSWGSLGREGHCCHWSWAGFGAFWASLPCPPDWCDWKFVLAGCACECSGGLCFSPSASTGAACLGLPWGVLVDTSAVWSMLEKHWWHGKRATEVVHGLEKLLCWGKQSLSRLNFSSKRSLRGGFTMWVVLACDQEMSVGTERSNLAGRRHKIQALKAPVRQILTGNKVHIFIREGN